MVEQEVAVLLQRDVGGHVSDHLGVSTAVNYEPVRSGVFNHLEENMIYDFNTLRVLYYTYIVLGSDL